MKPFLYLTALAATAIMALPSCSDDDFPGLDGDVTTFSIELPDGGAASRYGEGVTAKKLFVAITEAGEEKVLFSNFTGGDVGDMDVSGFKTVGGKQTATVSVRLARGKHYDLYFWAQSYTTTDGTTGPYKWDATNKTITIDYTDASTGGSAMEAYAEERDAFFAKEMNVESSVTGKTIPLYRPFAQINVGTDDVKQFENAGGTGGYGLKIEKVVDVLNLGTGMADASATLQNVTVTPAASPQLQTTGVQAFPYQPEKYRYVAMAYVLPGEHSSVKSNVNVYLNANNNDTFAEYSQVPVQMNFRTNIYGSLLTNPEVFTVTIEPNFAGSENIEWDGKELKPVTPVGGVYNIGEAAELAWIAASINDGTVSKHASIRLTSDIDLNNKPWTPISNFSYVDDADVDKWFSGSFDGDRHTIYGLNCINDKKGYAAGLIGVTHNAEVKYVTVASGSVKSADAAGAVVGVIRGNDSNYMMICDNRGATVQSATVAGGIVGRVFGSRFTMENCDNMADVIGNEVAGGLIGFADSGRVVIRRGSNYGTITGGNAGVGGILGSTGANIVNIDIGVNRGAVGTGSEQYAGGIVGFGYGNEATFVSAYNMAEVKGVVAGGICGSTEELKSLHIGSSDNSAVITGGSVAGGIVGTLGEGQVRYNVNTAAVVATGANSVAGGIVGKTTVTNTSIPVYNCSGGKEAITATTTGRQVGIGYKVTFTMNPPTPEDHSLPTLGSLLPGNADCVITVAGGQLIGIPGIEGNTGSQVIVNTNAGWSAFPGETGIFTVGADGEFHRQN